MQKVDMTFSIDSALARYTNIFPQSALIQVVAARYRERGNIEAHFFNLQSQLKSSGQRPYSPPEGKLIQDIERAWARLEKAEHDRELALRQELIRYECHVTKCRSPSSSFSQ